MKLIIAGGRHYLMTERDRWLLNKLHAAITVTEVVSGKATGADAGGEMWARAHGIHVEPFPAKWTDLSHPDALIRTRGDGTKYDAKAGFRRNEQMACYADACALFPGNSGTADMRRRARAHHLFIVDMQSYNGDNLLEKWHEHLN